MARQERAVRTRHAVIRAAAEVFAERGYAAATIAEILDRAGVTKGALYFHFDSKEALARGVIEAQITGDSHVPCELKLQEWVDVGMVLAYQIPRDAVLRGDPSLGRPAQPTPVRQRLARLDRTVDHLPGPGERPGRGAAPRRSQGDRRVLPRRLARHADVLRGDLELVRSQ